MQNLVQPLNAEIDKWYEKACQIFAIKNWKHPKLDIVTLKNKVAGMAVWPNNEIRINWTLYQQNQDEFFQRTVPHEIAHLVNFVVNGKNADGHGARWQMIMRNLGIKDVRPCHNYDTSSVRPVVTGFKYSCESCGNVMLVSSKHHYILVNNFNAKGVCPKCRNNSVVFTGKTERIISK